MEDKPKKPLWYHGKVGDMLRASGYVPLPRLWVRKERMDQIMQMAEESKAHVRAVRNYCRELEKRERENS